MIIDIKYIHIIQLYQIDHIQNYTNYIFKNTTLYNDTK